MPDRVTSLKLVCAQPLTAPAEHARSPLSFSEVDDTRFVGSTGGCIGLLTACLSEVGCTELHLVQESCALPTGAVSRSRTQDRSRNVGYVTG